ncbi:cupin domain-containing protein [Kitasatospora sp. NPDC048540]|uniref:cupin domain-containing protein n=1 Tax=Kitasatospora sp. NPDC048540 TaxID=3155634 RepID=UPI0033ED9CD9
MILVPAALPTRAPGFRRLIDPAVAPAALGGLTVEAVPAGGRTGSTAESEAVTLVLAGQARWASRVLGPGAGLYHPPGARYGLTADADAPFTLLTVYGPPVRNRPPGPAGPTGGGSPASVPLVRRPEHGSALTRGGGFAGMGVHWLATARSVGARGLTVATSVFVPGGRHALHCHPAADEFFLVLTGGGDHLTERGRVRLAAGDLAYVPAGEWHGFTTRPGAATTALYGYLGAGSLRAAGYRIRTTTAQEAS